MLLEEIKQLKSLINLYALNYITYSSTIKANNFTLAKDALKAKDESFGKILAFVDTIRYKGKDY